MRDYRIDNRVSVASNKTIDTSVSFFMLQPTQPVPLYLAHVICRNTKSGSDLRAKVTTLDILAIASTSSEFSGYLRIGRPCKSGRLCWLDSLASLLLCLFLSLSLLHLKRRKAGLQYVMLLRNLCNLHMQCIDPSYERGLGLTSRVVHNSFQRVPVKKLVFHQLLSSARITRIDAFDQ